MTGSNGNPFAPPRPPGRHRAALAMYVVLTGVLVALVAPSTRAAAQVERAAECGEPRLLVVSLPTLSWADLDRPDLPNLVGFLEEAAVGGMSVRAVGRSTSTGDGYATFNMGTRARGTADSGLAFQRGESFEGTPAADVFSLRTGREPAEGEVFFLGLPGLLARNAALPYDAEVGLLGASLADAGFERAVIGNADHQESLFERDYQRGAAVALMDDEGTVAAGDVTDRIVVTDPAVPFGERLDHDAVLDVFDEVWRPGSVVLVEASDLLRYDQFRSQATPAQSLRLQIAALRSTDELVGRLLDRVDPACDPVLFVTASHSRRGSHVTPAAVRGPGIEPGWLQSPSTGRHGFVNIVDIAPTVLDLVGLERPAGMEGRPYEYEASPTPYRDRLRSLIDQSADAKFRDSLVGPVSTWYVILQILLSVAAVIALRRTAMARLRSGVVFSALALQGFLVGSFLATLLPFRDWGAPLFWLFLFTVGAVVAALSLLVGRRDPVVDPLIVALGILWTTIALEVLAGTPLQWNGVFGYSPTVAGRFAGLGNLGYAMFCGSAILLAALISYRSGSRRGTWFGVGLLAVTLVIDGAPFWGADVGGILSFAPAAGVTAALLLGARVRWRTIGVLGLGAVVLVLGFGFVDLARPSAERTHLGRLFESVQDGGWQAFETVLLRKLGANLSVLTTSVWTLMLPAVFGFLGYLLWKAPGRLRLIGARIPQERAAVGGLLTLGVLGFALNDSGIAVPGMLAGVVNASLVYLLLRIDSLTATSVASEPDTPLPDLEVTHGRAPHP